MGKDNTTPSGATSTGVQAAAQAAESRQNVFTGSQFQPLPSSVQVNNALPDSVRAARLRLLGADAMDPEVVKIWWVGVSSFIVSMQGHLFLLDAWEIVGLHANYLPIGREDLVAIKPEAIFIGHGHFDHAADAGYIAGQTGAVLVGGSTVCDTARASAAREGYNSQFPCVNLGNDASGDDATAVGKTQSLLVWEDMPPVQVIRHTHSAAEPTDLLTGGSPLIFIPDVLTFPAYLNTNPAETIRFLGTLMDDGGVGQPEGGTWAYQFKLGDFTLFWHDSTGIMKDDLPESQAIVKAIEQLPDCIDVQLNAIVGFGMVTSAYRDALAYVKAARPILALPTHHDAWAPGVGGGAAAYEQSWKNALSTLKNPPELDYLKDPADYMKPRSFRVNDAKWKRECSRG
ncbi:MAG: MBL fold metallo-hydrolase [Limnobacter sp.]|nr:MBL fold metallo-hydrolase [Limnobacter sp.]